MSSPAAGRAAYHLVMEVLEVESGVPTPGPVWVRGVVRTLYRSPGAMNDPASWLPAIRAAFRTLSASRGGLSASATTPATLRRGVEVEFNVTALRPGDDVPLGPDWWLDYEGLRKARYLEVLLDPDEHEGFACVRASVLCDLTDTPRIAASGG